MSIGHFVYIRHRYGTLVINLNQQPWFDVSMNGYTPDEQGHGRTEKLKGDKIEGGGGECLEIFSKSILFFCEILNQMSKGGEGKDRRPLPPLYA